MAKKEFQAESKKLMDMMINLSLIHISEPTRH